MDKKWHSDRYKREDEIRRVLGGCKAPDDYGKAAKRFGELAVEARSLGLGDVCAVWREFENEARVIQQDRLTRAQPP